jgi:hypothetical protein
MDIDTPKSILSTNRFEIMGLLEESVNAQILSK